jgi:hypothetical protein
MSNDANVMGLMHLREGGGGGGGARIRRQYLVNLDEMKEGTPTVTGGAGGDTYEDLSIRSFAILYRMLCSEIFRIRAALDWFQLQLARAFLINCSSYSARFSMRDFLGEPSS